MLFETFSKAYLCRLNQRKVARQHTVATIGALTGASSGWIMPLISNNLQAWWTSTGGTIHTAGWLCLVGVPFSLRCLWAPCLERNYFPHLDVRRGWAIAAQFVITLSLVVIAAFEGWGVDHPAATAVQLFGFLMLSFAGGTLRSTLDAYIVDVSEESEHGSMTWWHTMFYRLSLFLMSGVAFWVAEVLGWTSMFLGAGLVMLGMAYGVSQLPTVQHRVETPQHHTKVVSWKMFVPSGEGKSWLIWLMVWSLSGGLVGALETTFMLKGLGMRLSEVGLINNMLGLSAGVAGGLLAPVMLRRCSSLVWITCMLLSQGLVALLFVALAQGPVPTSLVFVAVTVCFKKMVSAAMTTTVVMVLMERCDPEHLTSQYAFGYSFPHLFVALLGPVAGALVTYLGWTSWFYLTFVIALLTLLAIPWNMLCTTLSVYRR